MTIDAEATSPSLLLRARAGNERSWSQIAELYTPLVYAWCRKHGADPDLAGDITQEVFTTVYEKLGSFRKKTSRDTFRGWLWTVTRNKTVDHFRRLKDQPDPKGGTVHRLLLQELPVEEPEDSQHEINPNQAIFLKAIEYVRSEFEEKTWQAFWRTKVEDQKTADVASDLGMSTGAVRKARFRVMHRLREELGDLIEVN